MLKLSVRKLISSTFGEGAADKLRLSASFAFRALAFLLVKR